MKFYEKLDTEKRSTRKMQSGQGKKLKKIMK